MAYNLKLAERIRSELSGIPVVEKKIFGDVGFLLNGNTPALPGTEPPGRCASGASVACGVNKDDLIVRVDPERHSVLLKEPHPRPCEMTGRPMKGWLVVEADGYKTGKQLSTWIKERFGFAATLTPK